MAEYIERQSVLAKKFNLELRLFNLELPLHEPISIVLASEIERLAAADVRPVVHGRWLKRDDMPKICECKCSACGYADYPSKNDRYWFERNYCPNCGAKMGEAKT